MVRRTLVVAGPARSGKTRQLLDQYRRVLSSSPPGAALWLAPHYRAAAEVRAGVLAAGLPGALNPQLLTFDQFARQVLNASNLQFRAISPLGQRQLLSEVVSALRDSTELEYFRPIAATPGFLDLVVGFVRQMKRLEIWPDELRAACGRRPTEKERELCALYDAYQRQLTDHKLYDPEGRFWSAREQLREGRVKPFEHVRHVFVDGFTDFTRTEQEMLELLAARVESLVISLPLDADRRELFAKPRATLAELRQRHPELIVEAVSRRESGWAARDYLEVALFAAPGKFAARDEAAGVELLAAAGATHEIELVARRIKSLLVHGDPHRGRKPVRPGEILVVMRNLTEAGELVRQVFAEFGIPTAVGNRPPLGNSPPLKTLMAWLKLEIDDWPLRQLASLVAQTSLRPGWPECHSGAAALAAEHLARRAPLVAGRAATLHYFERQAAAAGNSAGTLTADPAPSDPAPSDPAPSDPAIGDPVAQRAMLAGPFVARVGRALDALPKRATLAEWSRAVEALAAELGIRPRPSLEPRETATAQCDLSAWQRMTAALDETARLDAWLGRSPRVLTLSEFHDHLAEVLRGELLPADQDESGCVRVLAADSARNLSAPYLFVAGLAERAFPQPEREDCLLGEAETRRLAEAGLPLSPRAERRVLEMLLFYEVITRAEQQLILSYPALDEAAQPLSPSPYLSELERLFKPDGLGRAPLGNLSGVPASDDVLSPREFRVRAVAQMLEGNPAMLKGLLVHPSTHSTAESVLAGLDALSTREVHGGPFGVFEGMLQSDAARAELRRRFGPEHHWSPSQLEQYASCPFQFFLDRVLGLSAIEDPVLAVDYSARGQMLHWLLAELHKGLNVAAQGRIAPGELAPEIFSAAIGRLLEQLQSDRASDRPLADGLLEIDLRRLTAWLAEYRQQHQAYDSHSSDWDAPLRPAHFEVSFGRRSRGAAADDTSDDPLSTSDPFVLNAGGETIRFAGRIDRIDLGQLGGQSVFSIIDYKSGRSEGARVKAIFDGTALQLSLYALATEWLLASHRALPARVGYWHLSGRGAKESVALHDLADAGLSPTAEWSQLVKRLPLRVAALVRGIRDGQFPMASRDDQCTSHCEFATVCRVNQARAREKDWQPPQEQAP